MQQKRTKQKKHKTLRRRSDQAHQEKHIARATPQSAIGVIDFDHEHDKPRTQKNEKRRNDWDIPPKTGAPKLQNVSLKRP